MIRQEIKNIKETPRDLKKFGLTIGTVLVLIAAYLFFKEKESAVYFAVIGALFIVFGLILPMVLRPINKGWMILAVLMGFVMTRVILSILYFVVLTPIAFIAKIAGKEFLTIKKRENVNSYWDIRTKVGFTPEQYERQF